ncbi:MULTISPECIES: hypothetical protein [Bradyrhizobium]|uniref:Uncharacterized protein n=5 Tax=Bradyrhizobium TaxID=374 RepID=A0A809WX06_9BRAD|nr:MULTISPECIES: hypothetical protein [Bradyrhizobium]AHY48483.1 hypothetical protein BJS_09044 [Bradyrhizobium japonicum SEMIA 5079]APG15151.1 hypothetical protein BKD09_43295 [Bradyrhizobium japonicum]APO50504.1 hypothetical protein BD122_09651 [Bradyrhizobium diazoefficiens]KGJ71516.1 hypothetical protein BJA5080_08013 [Bradyrhizobium diazoefficiens SEMIA 5080]MBP1059375.1 hypothetical protein [Bradyrhizobium japonicum]
MLDALPQPFSIRKQSGLSTRHIAGRSSSATASISNKALRIRPNESLSQAEGEAEIVVDGGEGDVGGVPLPAL